MQLNEVRATHFSQKKKNSMLLNEPFSFESNLILAWSKNHADPKGYKTAGTTIKEFKSNFSYPKL